MFNYYLIEISFGYVYLKGIFWQFENNIVSLSNSIIFVLEHFEMHFLKFQCQIHTFVFVLNR